MPDDEVPPTDAPDGDAASSAEAGEDVTPPEPPPPIERRLRRSRSERMIAGVSGGLGDYMGVDPVIVRIAFVLLTIFAGGLGLLLYIIAWIVMPLEPVDGAATRGARSETGHGGGSTGAVVLGLLLVVIGTVWLLNVLDVPTLPWTAVLSITLILVGLGLLWGSRTGRHGGLILLGTLLAVVLALATPVDVDFGFDGGFGDRTERPTALAELDRSYEHAFGSLTVDLRNLELQPGTTRVEVDIAFGEAVVWVPAGVPVRVESSTAFGSTEVFGVEHDGVGVDRVDTDDGYDEATTRLDLSIDTLFGSGKVRR